MTLNEEYLAVFLPLFNPLDWFHDRAKLSTKVCLNCTHIHPPTRHWDRSAKMHSQLLSSEEAACIVSIGGRHDNSHMCHANGIVQFRATISAVPAETLEHVWKNTVFRSMFLRRLRGMSQVTDYFRPYSTTRRGNL